MLQISVARMFRLIRGAIYCGREGLFIGAVPLFERSSAEGRDSPWRVRPTDDLNRELSACYGLPVDVAAKSDRLGLVARMLDRSELALAQIASLGLQFPDPPSLAKSVRTDADVQSLAAQLFWSGLLKGDWDPTKHPRLGGPPNAGRFANVPKEMRPPKPPRSGWPVRKVNVALRKLLPKLAWRAAEALPIVDAIAAFLEAYSPTELNGSEDRLTAQIRAYNYRPKTLEELQTRPTVDIMGYEQHHIVEQNDDNIAKNGDEHAKRIEKFGEAAIDDPSNIVWIPRLTHEQITAEYNSGYDNSEREENGQDEGDEEKWERGVEANQTQCNQRTEL